MWKPIESGLAWRFLPMLAVILILLSTGETVQAVQLLSGRAVPQVEGKTLVLLTFDEPVTVILTQKKGRSITLSVNGLIPGSEKVHSAGLLKYINVAKNEITLAASRYVEATIMPAGTGTKVVLLTQAKEPVTAKPKTVPSPQPEKIEKKEPEKTVMSSKPAVKKETVSVKPEAVGEEKISQPGTIERKEKEPPEKEPSVKEISSAEMFRQGKDLVLQKKNSEAIELLKKIKPVTGEYSKSRLLMGDAQFALKQFDKAVESYSTAKRDPELAEAAAIKLALVHQESGHLEEAGVFWEEALAIINGRELTESKMETEQEGLEHEAGQKGSNIAPVLMYSALFAIPLLIVGFIVYNKTKSNRMYKMLEEDDESIIDKEGIDIEPNLSSLEARVASLYSDQENIESDLEKWQSSSETIHYQPEEPVQASLEDITPPPAAAVEKPSAEPIATGPPTASWDAEPEHEPALQSPPQWEKIEEMHQQGASIREIAEALNIGQDEVRTVINLMHDKAEV